MDPLNTALWTAKMQIVHKIDGLQRRAGNALEHLSSLVASRSARLLSDPLHFGHSTA